MGRGNYDGLTHPPDSTTYPFQDIVRSEIEAAIEMFINHQNMVATHLLTNAAHELMRANARSKGVVLDADLHEIFRRITPKLAKGAIDTLQWGYNGLKHFKSEVEGNITLNTRHTTVALWLCVGDYVGLFKSSTDIMRLYFRWYVASKTDGRDWMPEDEGRFPSAPLDLPLHERLREAKIELAAINAYTDSLRS
jgi:hypothetical protein